MRGPDEEMGWRFEKNPLGNGFDPARARPLVARHIQWGPGRIGLSATVLADDVNNGWKIGHGGPRRISHNFSSLSSLNLWMRPCFKMTGNADEQFWP